MADSYLQNTLDSMTLGSLSFDNLPGLGDFHLQSALKEVSQRLLNEEKGRFREVESLRSYKAIYKDDLISSKPSCELLMMSMNLCKKNSLSCYNKEGSFDHLNVLSDSADMIRSRIFLERKLLGKFSSDWYKNDDLFNLLKSSNCYTRGRSLWSTVVTLMNSIGSGREKNVRSLERFGIKVIKKNEDLTSTIGNLYCVELTKKVYLFITGELVFLRDNLLMPKSSVGCWDINTVRMISDKCTERDIIIRSSLVGRCLYPELYPTQEIIGRMLDIGDICIEANGNIGYKMIKCYESICVGYLLTKSNDVLVDNTEFLLSTVNDLVKEYPQFEYFLERVLEVLEDCESVHHITQLYGLYRLWGHPNIDSVEGLKKVGRIGRTKKIINDHLSDLAGYHFLEMLFTKYYRKHKRYPIFELNDDSLKNPSYLVGRLQDNLSIDTSHELYDVADWTNVDLKQTFSVPETFNLAMIVDDKAISPDKSFLRDVAHKRAKFMNPYERRGVLKFLSQETQDCAEFLKSINDHGLADDYCVIGLYPKERELNNVPRMFSLMSAEMRKYIVMTEHMLAEDILPFFPQITMTSDLLSLTKMIYSATKIQERSGSKIDGDDARIMNLDRRLKNQFRYISVCVNMDFEKWNLNMRYEATKGVFTQLGRCYGMENLFNETYNIFQKSYIYVADENYRIEADSNSPDGLKTDDVYSYRGHIGGFEGLRQKGWTIFTVVVIKMICDKHKVQYKLMGQGDNQVLVLKLYTNQLDSGGNFTANGIDEMKIRLSNIMSDLEMTFGDLGLPLKTLESWKSESLFLYGKYPVFRGVPLSMSLKKICRCFPFSNDDNMTIDNVLGSIFTNAQAASMSELSLTIPYLIGLQEGYIGVESLMQYHPLIGQSVAKMISINKQWEMYNPTKRSVERFSIGEIPSLRKVICGILLCPKSLSGSNGITFLEFTMRGFPDNHSRDMSYLFDVMEATPNNEDRTILGQSCTKFVEYIQDISRNIARLCFVENLSPDFLVEDPCALNLLNPITPISVLRKKVKEVISQSGMIKNKDFKELFDMASDDRKNTLCNALIQNDVLFPRLLHDLYGATLFGYVDGIVSKVDKTSTVQKISMQSSPVDIMKLVMSTETNFLKFLVWRISFFRCEPLPGEPNMTCPTNYVRWGRYYGWGKQVIGVTVPFPSHTFSGGICQIPVDSCQGGSYVSAYISQNVPLNKYTRMTTIGKSPPYLGSYTKEKVKTYEKVSIYGSEPLLRRVLKALKVVGWAIGEGSNVHEFLLDVLSSISDLDGSLFTSDSDQVSGSMGHRYHDAALKHGALLPCMYTMGTWCHISTDTLTDYSKGSKNVTLHFQALLCWVQIFLNEVLVRGSNDLTLSSYHFHVTCKNCIVPVEDEIPDISKISKSLIPTNKSNPYCYVKNVDITRRDHSTYNLLQKFMTSLGMSVDETSNGDKFYIIHEYYAERICQDIISNQRESSSSTHVSSGLMDVGEYPRISFTRLNPLYLFSAICFKIIVEALRKRANSKDEISWSLVGMTQEAISIIKTCPSSGFLGLGTFYSWPEKIKDILEIPGSISPSEYPFSIDQANVAAKESLVQFSQRLFEVSAHREGNIINFVEGSNMINCFLGKVFLRYLHSVKEKESAVCQQCLRSIFKNYLSLILDDVSATTHKCKFKHYMPEFKDTVDNYRFVSFSIDAVEKAYELRKPPSISKILCVERQTESRRKLRRFQDHSVVVYNSKKDKEECLPTSFLSIEHDNLMDYTGTQLSRLFRLIPYEESTCYRVFELLRSDIFLGMNIRDICVLGDGSGGSSVTVAEYYQVPKMSMTMSSCDVAYPQTYPHAIPPSILENGYEKDINYSESLSYRMDITNQLSREYLSRSLSKLNCRSIISEIEFEHNSGDFSEYLKMPKYIHELMIVDKAAVKIRMGNNSLHDMDTLLECSSTYWKNFSVIITPFCNVEKREVWLILGGRKRDESEMVSKSFSKSTRTLYQYQALMTIRQHFEHNIFNDLEESYYKLLNELMMNSSRTKHSSRIVENYIRRIYPKFSLGKKISWSAFLYDSVFNKVPRFIWNMGSKVGKYRYENEERDLWQIMIMIMCAYSKSIVFFKYIMDKCDDWRVYLIANDTKRSFTQDNLRIGIVLSSKRLRFSDKVRSREISLSGDNFKGKLLRYVPLMLHMYPHESTESIDEGNVGTVSKNRSMIGHDVFIFGRKKMFELSDDVGYTLEGKATYLKKELSKNRINLARVFILPISKTLSRKLSY
ncbi:TPA_asm: L [Nitraria betacytorhabdovirus 1]|nr:TPA_asm: L [Nitraria betacytorhabdovirus 1]